MTSAIDIAIGPATVAEASVIAAVHAEAAVRAFSGIFPDSSATPTASSLEPGWTDLLRLYVRPDHWNGGIGTRLHGHAMECARGIGAGAMNLWVLEENHRGRQMYEARGWRLIRGRYLLNDPPEVRDVLYEHVIA